jgi:hypothetical protein
MRIGQPERLVINEELNELAVGHVTNRLASFGETISFFAIDDRACFIEPIDESAILGVGAAFFRAPAHAEISVAERRHRFQLGQEFRVKRFFDDVPLIGRIIMGWRPEAFMVQHRAVPPTSARGVGHSTSSLKSSTTRCAP